MKNNPVKSKINSNAERIAKLDDYELPAEFPFDRRKMKRNPYAGRVHLTHGGKRANAGRKPSPQPLERHTITLYTAHAKFLRALDKNLSKAVRKLIERNG